LSICATPTPSTNRRSRQNEGVSGDHAVGLPGNLFCDEADGNKFIFHAGAEDLFGLEKGLGDLVEAGKVILVVLDRVEGHGEGEVREVCVDASSATGCAEGHLILFEVVVFDALLQLAKEEVVGDEVLLGKAGRVDRLDPGEVGEVALVPGGGRGERVVPELIVISVVANSRGQGGIHLEGGLPGVVEEGVLDA